MQVARIFKRLSPGKPVWQTRPGLVLAVAMMITALAVTTAGAAHHVETVVQFDAAAGQLAEGVTVDKTGNVFASLSPLGQLVKIAPGSNVAEPFGFVAGLAPGDFGLLGLAVDAPGNVYGGVVSGNPDAHGVWRFDRKTGAAERVPGTEALIFPNSIAFDKRGTMYITDMLLGAVWRVPKGGAAEPWIIDPLLAGDGSYGYPFPLGANGIAIRHNTVYVGVTEGASIVTVPILADGSAGAAAHYADVGTLVDGIALDVHGNVYVAAPAANSVLRVNAEDGSVETLATLADGLDAPTSVAFGTGKGDRQSVYAANFSIAVRPAGDPAFPAIPNPSVVKIAVGVPGLPQP